LLLFNKGIENAQGDRASDRDEHTQKKLMANSRQLGKTLF